MQDKGNVSECLVRGKCQFGVWRKVLPQKNFAMRFGSRGLGYVNEMH